VSRVDRGVAASKPFENLQTLDVLLRLMESIIFIIDGLCPDGLSALILSIAAVNLWTYLYSYPCL
jgi:hypothetical protein